MIQLSCEQCGMPYSAIRRSRRFCSISCSAKRRKTPEHREAMRIAALKRYESAEERAATGMRTSAYWKQWHDTHQPESVSERARRKRYGLTKEQMVGLFDSQNGLCGICTRPISLAHRGFHVDHDHVSTQVRGLLCQHCNTRLGWFERYSEQIAAYLARHRREAA